MQTNERGTTNLTVTDRWGNVVEYTLTIEQIGGNAMLVPGRGFLLNNEMTDFNFTPTQGTAPDPNLPAPGKRPRSSMAPTILLRQGKPFLATGSPGGSMIITTVFQILLNRIDLGMTLPEADRGRPCQSAKHGDGCGRAGVPASSEMAELMALGHTLLDDGGNRGGDRRGVPAQRAGGCSGGAGPPGWRFSGGRQAVKIACVVPNT